MMMAIRIAMADGQSLCPVKIPAFCWKEDSGVWESERGRQGGPQVCAHRRQRWTKVVGFSGGSRRRPAWTDCTLVVLAHQSPKFWAERLTWDMKTIEDDERILWDPWVKQGLGILSWLTVDVEGYHRRLTRDNYKTVHILQDSSRFRL
jgi:hypothetical protein